MSQPSSNNLRFSIDETIWLKEGQEAEEILSLALEPDITIEENRSHVNIKGGLTLTGDYRPVDQSDQQESDESPMRDQLSFRTIDEISLSDEGIATLEHTFPVDITIPSNRICDLDDVYVMVESFDYDIPEQGCIQLFADISISGLVDRESELSFKEDTAEDNFETPMYPFQRDEEEYDSIYQTFEGESAREHEQIEEEEHPGVSLRTRQDEESDDSNGEAFEDDGDSYNPPPRMTDLDNSASENDDYDDEVSFSNYKENTYEEDPRENVANQQSVNNIIENQPEAKVTTNVNRSSKKKKTTNENIEPNKEAVEETNMEENKGAKHSGNTLYLTKMLSNDEEQHAKVRMCIVQRGDSLEKISERYRIPVTTLLRNNRLDSDSVEEGEVLYIPISIKNN